MSVLYWNGQNFTDSAVLAKLEGLDKEEKVGVLWLDNNRLTSSPPLTSYPQFDTLRELDLWGNKLREVRVRDMPLSVGWVRLEGNHIKVLGDWSGHTKVKQLKVSSNPLTEIRGLPSGIEKLDLDDCPVEVLHRACFGSKNAYNVIKKALSPAQISKLKQPPPEVFKRGFDAVKQYYRELEHGELVLNSRNRLILLGETEAGKSSLMESLIGGKGVLIDILDRTQVVDIKRWPITANDVYMVYDQGGHEVYTITNHLFIAKQATVVLVHDITKITEEDIQKSIDVFLRTLQQHPTTDIHVALTHIDKLDAQTLQQNITKFKDAVAKMYRREIDNFGRLIKDIDNEKKCEELQDIYQKKEASTQYFQISSLNYQGVPELKSFLSQTAAAKRVAISDKWVTCFKLIAENKDQYLRVAQVEQMMKKAYGFIGNLMPRSRLNVLTTNFLRYLSDTGLVLWFEDNRQLNQYVFHNLEYIVELLKSLFHHDLHAHLDFKNNTKLQKLFTQVEFKHILSQYENEGLLHYKLISAIWNQYGIAAPQQDTLVELLKAFNICYGVGSDNSVLYFPWFVRRKQPPEHIKLANPVIVNKQHTTILLQCVFYNRIPSNIFEMLSICLQRQAVLNNYIGDRYSWKNGLVVEINDIECIVFRNPSIYSLLLCLRGRVSSLIKMWEICSYIFQDLQLILAQWQGVLENQYFHCVHCVHRRMDDPHKWLPSQVLGQKHKRKSSTVKCNKESIPEALVVNLSGITNVDQAVRDVEAYLQENCADAPRQLEYIECTPQGDNYKVSWEVAQVPTDEDTKVVIDYREPGGQWWQHGEPVMGTSCVVSGLPTDKKFDFRVRPENQTSEDHAFVVESEEMQCADEALSEDDQHKLLQYHTLFIRMSSLSTVLHKLCVRNVINDRMLERLRRKLTRDGPIDVAEDIVEHIKRLKYTHLYKFKKTLEETGQLYLAELLPMKLKGATGGGVDATSDRDIQKSDKSSSRLLPTEVEPGLDETSKPTLPQPEDEQVPGEETPKPTCPPSQEPLLGKDTATSTPSKEGPVQDGKKSTTTSLPSNEEMPPKQPKQKPDKSSPRLPQTENEPGLDETSTQICTPPFHEIGPPEQPRQKPDKSSPRLLSTIEKPGLDETSTPILPPLEEQASEGKKSTTTSPPSDELMLPEQLPKQPPEATSEPFEDVTKAIPSTNQWSVEAQKAKHPKQKPSIPVTKPKLPTAGPPLPRPNTALNDRNNKRHIKETESSQSPRASDATPKPLTSNGATTRPPLPTMDSVIEKRSGETSEPQSMPPKSTSVPVHKPHHFDQPNMRLPMSSTQTIFYVKQKGRPIPGRSLTQMTHLSSTIMPHLQHTDQQATYNHPVLRELQTDMERHMEPTEQLISLLDLLGVSLEGIGQCETDLDKVKYVLRIVDSDSQRLLPVLIEALSKCEKGCNTLLAGFLEQMLSHAKSPLCSKLSL